MTISVSFDLHATYAERIVWWEEEKQNCEYQLNIATEYHDCPAVKNWKKEIDFCNKNIKKLKEEQTFYAE
jgi:hypothetical protein